MSLTLRLRPFFVGLACFASTIDCINAQGLQEAILGRWQIDWKETAKLGGKSEKEANDAAEQGVTRVVYEFMNDGTLTVHHTRNMDVKETPQTWTLTAEDSKDGILRIKVTVLRQGTYPVVVKFQSADRILIESQYVLPPIILKRVK